MVPTRSALVTGGSAGLGYHVAERLAARGYRLTIVGRDEARLAKAAGQFVGSAHRLLALDLSLEDDLRKLVRHVEAERFDVLVNNAGAARFGPVSAATPDALKSDLYLNLLAPILLSRAFVSTAAPGSMLVNVTSIVGRVPMPGNAVYSAAKAGLQAFTECLWYEARDRRITVLDFRPVSLKTDFHRAAGGESMSSSWIAAAPHAAARDLVAAVERSREFSYLYGWSSTLLDFAGRVLPRRLLVRMMGRKSRAVRYL